MGRGGLAQLAWSGALDPSSPRHWPLSPAQMASVVGRAPCLSPTWVSLGGGGLKHRLGAGALVLPRREPGPGRGAPRPTPGVCVYSKDISLQGTPLTFPVIFESGLGSTSCSWNVAQTPGSWDLVPH